MRTTIANRLLNPLAVAVLRSPLHRLTSRTNALVTCRGRRSGRTYTLPVRYAEDPDGLWLHAARPETKTWWRNLEGGAPVTVRLRGREFAAHAEAIRDDQARVTEGLWSYYRRFPALAKSIGLSWEPSSVEAAAARSVVVRVELQREPSATPVRILAHQP